MNEGLREILPLLRPRIVEPSPVVKVLFTLLCAGLLAMAVGYFVKRQRHRQAIHKRFWNSGKDRGLKPKQLRFLARLARKHSLNDPSMLLNSVYSFDRHVGQYATRAADRNPEDPVLKIIAQMRETLGFDSLDVAQPMRTTRQLEPGVTLMVQPEAGDTETFSPWLVVGRDERGLSVTLMLREDRREFRTVTEGSHLSARFWREQDTEYRFTTEILSVDEASQTIRLKHVHDLQRMQQRGFFRIAVHFPMLLRVLPEEAGPKGTEAAIALLDSVEGSDEEDDEIVETPEGGPDTGEGEEDEAVFDPRELPTIQVDVMDLSAGGLNVRTQDTTTGGFRVLIDPDFEGAFPLGGIVCQVMRDTADPNGRTLQLRFVDLPPGLESTIVRTVYQHQIFEMTGEEIEIPQHLG